MTDIYWLITLGNLSSACIAIFVISLCVLFICAVVMFFNTDRYLDSEKLAFNFAWRTTKFTSIAFVFGILGMIFIPSERQLYAIYGIGGVVDYVKQNDTAKQIPDKAVNYLDAWIDKQIDDEKKSKKDLPYAP